MKKILGEVLVLIVVLLANAQALIRGPWYNAGRVHPDEYVCVTFAITQTNPEWLKEKLKAVSYPDSPDYGNYMTAQEIAEHVNGSSEASCNILCLLESSGVPRSHIDFTIGKDFVAVNMTIENAEKFFDTKFYELQAFACNSRRISADDPSLPDSLANQIDFVSGLINPPFCLQTSSFNIKPTPNMQVVTPEVLAVAYNTSFYVSSNKSNSQGVVSFGQESFSVKDLSTFRQKHHIREMPVRIVGPNFDKNPSTEANLDIQFIEALGRGIDTWFLSSCSECHEDVVDWIILQVNGTKDPLVQSVSHGQYEHSLSDTFLKRMDYEFMKMGIMGKTLIFATGDSGVNCRHTEGEGEKEMSFTPNWPASSAYVTSVGGTANGTHAWIHGGSGFSNMFPRPEYQAKVVDKYLLEVTNTANFNASNRAYPDVSTFSTNCIYIKNGVSYKVDGTSCSAPIFAGLVAILNDVRLNKGVKPLGFLNPLLYMKLKGRGFTDIMHGHNGYYHCEGFNTTQGWDAATGWGSPNFGLLKDLI